MKKQNQNHTQLEDINDKVREVELQPLTETSKRDDGSQNYEEKTCIKPIQKNYTDEDFCLKDKRAGTHLHDYFLKDGEHGCNPKVMCYFFHEEDVKEFINLDWKNFELAKQGKISWEEYSRRKQKLTGFEND